MPLPDAKPDRRIYELLKTTDLENLTFSDFQKVAQTIYAEQGAEDELRRIVLVNLARLSVAGEWTGLTSAGASGPATVAAALRLKAPNTSFDLYPLNIGEVGKLSIGTAAFNKPRFMPFTISESGNLTTVHIFCSGATSSATLNVGIYTSVDGLPSAKISQANIDTTSTGNKTATLDATTTLELGTQYFCGYCTSVSGDYATVYGSDADYQVAIMPTDAASQRNMLYELSSSDNTLPSTVNAANLETTNSRTPSIKGSF